MSDSLDNLIGHLQGLAEQIDTALSAARAMQEQRDSAEQAAAEDQAAAEQEQRFPDHDLLDVPTAALRFRGEKPDTLRHWCEHEGMGVKRGRRWSISVSMPTKRLPQIGHRR